MKKVKYIVVHYSATYEDQDITAADIDRMHKTRGFDRIGYHYFIRRDGTLEVGRKENETGAHAKGYNSQAIGVCWAGGLNRATGVNKGVDNRTPAQTATLIRIIKDLLVRYPGATVIGHRDLPGASTQCPGFNVYAWWKGVKDSSDNNVLPEPNLFSVTKVREIENLAHSFKEELMKLVRS